MKPARLALCAFVMATSACSKGPPDPQITEEVARREAFSKAVLIDAGALEASKVRATDEIQYIDGFSIVMFEPREDPKAHAFRYMGQKGHVRLKTHGNQTMRLKLVGWVDQKAIHVKPRVSLYFEGFPVEAIFPTGKVDENQFYYLEADVDPKLFRGKEWVDLDIVWNAAAYHWIDPPELRVIVLSELSWEPKK